MKYMKIYEFSIFKGYLQREICVWNEKLPVILEKQE